MADRSASTVGPKRAKPPIALDRGVREDLRRKQELLSAACRCLDDVESYRFFHTLASLANLPPDTRVLYLGFLEATGEYSAHELAAIGRLIAGEGAVAFKDLVDLVREIRVQQEIEAMVR